MIATFADGSMPPFVPLLAAGGDGGGSNRGGPLVCVTGRHVLIWREVLYLAEQDQLDVNAFERLGFWNQRGTDSV